ncbi:MAG: phospho-N-acetylmuramoyl-pentapeptide-transferase [Acidimicrobiales bacterium]|nr:phospho-N-acetylmuramoyl-pentapeptide-transferase [Acidimicrobiales bacterium]
MTRLLVAAAISMMVSLFGTKALINWLTRHRMGQPIRDDGPQGHHLKAGTPTMGGLAIIAGVTAGYIVSELAGATYTRRGIFVMLAIIGGGVVGLMDDWVKVKAARNLGLNKRAKMAGLLLVAVGFAFLMTQFTEVQHAISFTRFDSPGWDIGRVGWMLWAVLLILGTTNAVNLTDGLDGLAAGAGALAFAAFTFISFWQFRQTEVDPITGDVINLYGLTAALDLAVVSAAMVGGIIGFLWWNAAPAQIFMGDTGSLAIGSGLAALALSTNTHLLLPIIGGLFVVETISVILQVFVFRMFNGRRLFRMAPVHHHFELLGWPETTILIRLWIMTGLCTAVGLGLFYADAINAGFTS